MQIDKATLHKIANLARLEITPEEEAPLLQSLENVLSWMEHLNELDTDNVAPLTHISSEINVMREDVVGDHLPREQGLYNAPSQDGTYFRVPKVIE
ncbi:Asp-tRNA(Asn)/Glu-tRNA(Gln) amidotransferase subunit GatC [Runella aurantiaca]|uniref:Aspartyl/glutamyl-tRNA(Asn/Gln) amidotransferase subunit C n=1 Tax=Runella aurantiaca TaxID=2282308 RepID=A0A369IBF6_9BACT|nr:Asp-tRNA(Asn)/Glu-tRNA(Gln) amidotransferase subunit GatC [Runella aurantiaca]RDB04544.1 Asp-tRNA(Asn)/Glu-tRNA(Gln) amidotransferase subunit GatC [Runella aurantiaca]